MEYNHFLNDNTDFDFGKYKFKKVYISPLYVQEAIVKIKEKKKISFFDRSSIRRRLKIKSSFFKFDKDNSILLLQNFYYLAKIYNIKKQIEDIDKYMKGESLDYKLKVYRELSNAYDINYIIIILQS